MIMEKIIYHKEKQIKKDYIANADNPVNHIAVAFFLFDHIHGKIA
jgi:hypothetical protein